MVDIAFATEFISPIALVVCLVVGFVIKSFGNAKVNRFIPVIVAVLGLLICAWDAMEFTPSICATGLISGLASTGLYEAFKQLMGLSKEND